jgi:hypothetical protein
MYLFYICVYTKHRTTAVHPLSIGKVLPDVDDVDDGVCVCVCFWVRGE